MTSLVRRFAQYKGAARIKPDGVQWKRKNKITPVIQEDS